MTTPTNTTTTAWLSAVHRRWPSPHMRTLAGAIVAGRHIGDRFVLDDAARLRLFHQTHLRSAGLALLLSRLTDAGLLIHHPPAPGARDSYTLALPHPPIGPVAWNDIGECAATAATTLATQPLARWLIPDPGDRIKVLTDYLSILLGHALIHGFVDQIIDGHGAAAWINDTAPVPPPINYLGRRRQACGKYSGNFAVLDAAIAASTPAADHYRLALLTAPPGTEHASALLEHRHSILDREGVAAHATHVDVNDQAGYRQHGYQPAPPIHLTETGLSLHPMWRPPRSPRATEPGS